MRERTERTGQGPFSTRVRRAYGVCAVTGEWRRDLLQAAHIIPWGISKDHSIGNGILLRQDIHAALDNFMITFDESGEFIIRHVTLCDMAYAGRRLALPKNPKYRPSKKSMDWHRAEFLKFWAKQST